MFDRRQTKIVVPQRTKEERFFFDGFNFNLVQLSLSTSDEFAKRDGFDISAAYVYAEKCPTDDFDGSSIYSRQ